MTLAMRLAAREIAVIDGPRDPALERRAAESVYFNPARDREKDEMERSPTNMGTPRTRHP